MGLLNYLKQCRERQTDLACLGPDLALAEILVTNLAQLAQAGHCN